MLEGIRKTIERLCHQGKKGSEIVKLWLDIVSQSDVYKVIKRIKETGSCILRVRTTSPWPVRTPQLIKITQKKIQRNCRKSARQLAKNANISNVTMQKLLKNDLKKTPYKTVKRQLLSQQKKMMRLQRGKGLLQRLLKTHSKKHTASSALDRRIVIYCYGGAQL